MFTATEVQYPYYYRDCNLIVNQITINQRRQGIGTWAGRLPNFLNKAVLFFLDRS